MCYYLRSLKVNVIHQDSDELSAMCNYFLRALISDSCILTPLSLLSNLWILLPLRSRFDTGDLSSPNEATSGRFPWNLKKRNLKRREFYASTKVFSFPSHRSMNGRGHVLSISPLVRWLLILVEFSLFISVQLRVIP